MPHLGFLRNLKPENLLLPALVSNSHKLSLQTLNGSFCTVAKRQVPSWCYESGTLCPIHIAYIQLILWLEWLNLLEIHSTPYVVTLILLQLSFFWYFVKFIVFLVFYYVYCMLSLLVNMCFFSWINFVSVLWRCSSLHLDAYGRPMHFGKRHQTGHTCQTHLMVKNAVKTNHDWLLFVKDQENITPVTRHHVRVVLMQSFSNVYVCWLERRTLQNFCKFSTINFICLYMFLRSGGFRKGLMGLILGLDPHF